jgi:hypothetical protein
LAFFSDLPSVTPPTDLPGSISVEEGDGSLATAVAASASTATAAQAP